MRCTVCTEHVHTNMHTHHRNKCLMVQPAAFAESKEKRGKQGGEGVERGWQTDRERESKRKERHVCSCRCAESFGLTLLNSRWAKFHPHVYGRKYLTCTNTHTCTHHHVPSTSSLMPDGRYHLLPDVSEKYFIPFSSEQMRTHTYVYTIYTYNYIHKHTHACKSGARA